ncbi:MAG: ABC transporter permease [Deltaproteobacteria bacterium]|nr:ABC transporter permease [Deltaproteobacteria bacterium]
MKNKIIDQFIRSMAIVKKDVRIYYSRPPVVLMGVLWPAIMFGSFAFGRGMAIEALIPGLIGVSVFFTCSAITPVAFPWETAQRTLERLISSPISTWTILFGDMLSSAIVGVAISIIPILIAVGFGVTITNPFVLGFAIIAGSICFSTMALLLSIAPVSGPHSTQMLSTVIKVPLLFLSGVFIPLGDLPTAARTISYISPLTYFTDIARYTTGHGSYLSMYIDFTAIIIFIFIFWIVAVKLHNRTLPMRV